MLAGAFHSGIPRHPEAPTMNSPAFHRIASCIALFAGSAAFAPCAVASTQSASSASSVASESVGSVSTSIEKSSASSSPGKRVAGGDYRIIHMAQAAERPGMWRLNLQAVAGSGGQGEFFLYLPQAVLDKTPALAEGAVVTARERPYGLELSQGSRREAFFLVLDDEWQRDLQTRALTL